MAANLDALFGITPACEEVIALPIQELREPEGHPFQVRDDEDMAALTDSVSQYGVLDPVLVRRHPDGRGFELLSGNRRCRAAYLAGLTTVPSIVRELDDDAAIIAMVDSNLQRTQLLPSEKAAAYKMRLEAMERKRGRPAKDSLGEMPQGRSDEILAELTGETRSQIQRYIRLAHLSPDLLERVDAKQLPVNTGVALSHLDPDSQELLSLHLDTGGQRPSLAQAKAIREMESAGTLRADTLRALLETEPIPDARLVLPGAQISGYFPSEFSQQEKVELILTLLKQWNEKTENA